MSADNYIYVRKRPDGRYGISHRFASGYYADEGHTVESLQEWYDECEPGKYVIDSDWIIPENAEKDIEVYDDPREAVMAAHRMYEREAVVEYGVRIGEGIL